LWELPGDDEESKSISDDEIKEIFKRLM
jgi:hypothetical protein